MNREERFALTALVALVAITAAWWALALWPVDAAPAWLERTRYVCFGVTETGLPDAGGWVGLVGGPLGMLIILLFGWGRGLLGVLRRARTSRALAASLAVVLAAVMLLAHLAGMRITRAVAAAEPVTAGEELPVANYPRLDRVAPALALIDQHGTALDLAQLRGRPVLVTFAFAHCTTICPTIVKHVLDAQAEFRDVTALIVTLDPWRDTPSRLPALATSWGLPGQRAHVLSGDVAAVEAVLDAWEVPRMRDEVTGDVSHPSLVYVVDRNGRIAFASNGNAATLAALVRRL